ncbi:MAG: hypothetical protein ACFFC7_28950, partial [Candidatus Hermodarchaeota archaeon]
VCGERLQTWQHSPKESPSFKVGRMSISLADLPLLFITFLMLIPLDPFDPPNYPYLGFFSLQASLILLFSVYIYFVRIIQLKT